MNRAGDSLSENFKSKRLNEKRTASKSYFPEKNSQIIIEFNKNANPDIVDSIQNKLENEKFTIIRHGRRMYLAGDELSMLFEAQLNGLVKFDQKERRWKSFRLEDYLGANSNRQPTVDDLSEILTRSEKIRVCQHMIEENIQISKAVHIPTIGNCYPGQSFLIVCLKSKIIRQIFSLHDEQEKKELTRRWSNYLAFLCLVRLPVHEIKDYLNENIAFYFQFVDKLIKMLSLPVLSYTILVGICNLANDHPITTLTCSSAVYLGFLVFIKVCQYSRSELTSEWRMDGELAEKQCSQPKLDYKCRAGLYQAGRSIRQLIPKPEETRRQFRSQRKSWFILMILFTALLAYQVLFFHLNQQGQHIAFNSIYVHYVSLNLIRYVSAKFIVHRTDLEEYFTLKEYQLNVLTKMLILNSLVHSSLPVLYLLFASNPMLVVDILCSQLLINLIIEVAFNLLVTILSYAGQRIHQIAIEGNPFLESDFVQIESSKSKFGDLMDEWLFLFQQMVYVLLFCSAYPKIVTIVFLNILIRNFINFLKICLLCKRPLFENDFYSKAIEQCLGPLLVLASIVNLLNLDLFFCSDLISSLNITAQQWNMVIIFAVSFIGLIVWMLPDQSVKSKHRRQSNELKKFATFRTLDETDLNQTVDNVQASCR